MHLIHDRFTRLMGAIDFNDVDLDAAATLPAHLPGVPAIWSRFHSPALVTAVDDRLSQLTRYPTETEHHKSGQRRVQVLGTAIYDIATDGQVQCAVWGFNGDDLLILEAVPSYQISAEGSPHQDLWFDGFYRGIVRCLKRRHPPKYHPALERYVRRLRRCLLAHHWDAAKATWVRAAVAVALGLDEQTLDRARRLHLVHDDMPLRLSQYNRALVRQPVDERLLQEAPQLAVLHRLLALVLDDHSERTQAMRSYLLRNGITPGMWALLQQAGTDWLREFIPYYGAKVAWQEIACDVLRVAQAFGTDALVEPVLLHGLMTLAGHPNNPQGTARFAKTLQDLFDLAARMGVLYRRGNEVERQRLLSWVHHIVLWADTHWGEISLQSRRQLTTKGLIRRVQAHWKLMELELQSLDHWDLPWELSSNLPGLECHLLHTPLEAWEEGKLMHHCAGSYIERCADGNYLLISVRPNDGGRPVATIGVVRKEHGFELGMVSGFANQLVNPKLKSLALDCVRQLNEQALQRVPLTVIADSSRAEVGWPKVA